MGKSGVLSAAKKNSNSLCFQGGGGMRKTVRDADGRKNRVNTESSDPIPRGWVGEGGIGKEACSVVKAVAWNRNIS